MFKGINRIIVNDKYAIYFKTWNVVDLSNQKLVGNTLPVYIHKLVSVLKALYNF